MRNPRRPRDRAGVTLIEVIIALGILVIALFGLMSAISYSTRSNAATRENMLAMRAAEKKVEEMLSNPFDQIFGTFTTAANKTFDVTIPPPANNPTGTAYLGLQPQTPGAKVGTVFFATDGAGQLLESLTGALMGNGTNFDLDGDGVIDTGTTGDKATTYKVLPVKIEIKWKGVLGNREMLYRHVFLTR